MYTFSLLFCLLLLLSLSAYKYEVYLGRTTFLHKLLLNIYSKYTLGVNLEYSLPSPFPFSLPFCWVDRNRRFLSTLVSLPLVVATVGCYGQWLASRLSRETTQTIEQWLCSLLLRGMLILLRRRRPRHGKYDDTRYVAAAVFSCAYALASQSGQHRNFLSP